MKSKPQSLVILGAGPAGMACAMELHKAGHRFTLIEKSSQVGGLSKTYRFGQFSTDNGPHRFFSKNPYLYSFIKDLLNEEWIQVTRHTRFFIHNKYFQYPIQWRDVITKLGYKKVLVVLKDYVQAKYQYRGKPLNNFEDYVVANFGRSLAELNMLNYTEKIWGLPCSQLSSLQAKQRIKDLSITSLLKNTFAVSFNKPKTLIDHFYYPSRGTGTIYEAILKKIKQQNQILLNNQPTKICHHKRQITMLQLKSGKEIHPQKLVSSIPITEFIQLLDPLPPKKIIQSCQALRYRSQVYLFITVNQPQIGPDQWIYFPEQHIPFGRISEMKNFSFSLAPLSKTSLFIEFFCWEGDATWTMSKQQLFKLSLPYLEEFNLLNAKDVIDIYHIKAKNVYPVYKLGYEQHLKVIQDYLDQFSNLEYIGRPGRFRWNNQDHSLEMGILAAKSLINNQKYDINAVGQDNEYQEAGKLQN